MAVEYLQPNGTEENTDVDDHTNVDEGFLNPDDDSSYNTFSETSVLRVGFPATALTGTITSVKGLFRARATQPEGGAVTFAFVNEDGSSTTYSELVNTSYPDWTNHEVVLPAASYSPSGYDALYIQISGFSANSTDITAVDKYGATGEVPGEDDDALTPAGKVCISQP